jgi:Tfx family DNA-binding protein
LFNLFKSQHIITQQTKKADELGVKVPYSTAEIIAFLVEHAPIHDRLAKRDFTLFLDREDRLRVSECILEDFEEIGNRDNSKDTS